MRVGGCALVLLLAAAPAWAQGSAFSLRFFGHGTGQIDRVEIPLDAPARPVDVGAGDFTVELWMKATAAENGAGNCVAGNDGWILGNIIVDRDVYGPGDRGDFGLALFADGLGFGAADSSAGGGLCGATDVADGAWHHVAVTRNATTGELRLFVDGALDGSASGPTGDLSYRDGRSGGAANDPFLVLGAEKHDAGAAYPSYSGFLDELRISTSIRYPAAFTPPTSVFAADADTAALYHFDEGPAGPCSGGILDSSGAGGGPSHGACNFGGGAPAGPLYAGDTPPLAGALCPNGDLDPGEACDDDNLADGDGCDSNCTLTACGNGIATSGESCDDGNATAGDGCEPDCTRTPWTPLSGRALVVRDRLDDTARRKIAFVSRDAAVAAPASGSSGDPVAGGAHLTLARDTAEVDEIDLPAAGWRALGSPPGARGFRYSDRGRIHGPCRSARLRHGLLRVTCTGAQIDFSLDEAAQGALTVAFTSGSSGPRACARFGGTVTRDRAATAGVTGLFKARQAAAPAMCPLP